MPAASEPPMSCCAEDQASELPMRHCAGSEASGLPTLRCAEVAAGLQEQRELVAASCAGVGWAAAAAPAGRWLMRAGLPQPQEKCFHQSEVIALPSCQRQACSHRSGGGGGGAWKELGWLGCRARRAGPAQVRELGAAR